MVTLICWLLLKTVESKSLCAALLLGAITGFAFLLRSVFILWVPLIVIGVYLLGKSRMRSWFSPSAFRLPAIILVSFIIVVAPWMIRNSLVLGGFYPLGTMGSTSLSAAYSDEAVNNRGVWFDLSRAGFFDQLPIEKMSLLEQEKIKADYSRDVAIKWVRSNPTEIPKLAFFKISGMWKPYGKVAPIILFFAALGFLFLVFNKSRFAFSLFVFIAACTFSVAVTWTTTRDRFLIPILPILSMLAAMGIWYLAISTEKYLSERLNRLEPI